MKPLLSSYLHRKRIQMVKPHLEGDILDIGCGPADITKFLNEEQYYCGIEHNEALVGELKIRYPQYEFYYKNVDKEELNLNRKFDAITMIAVIEHLKNPENILQQCYNLLRDDGNLIITTPTPLGGKIHKIDAKLGLTTREAAEEHQKLYSYEDMKSLLTSHGFKIYIYISEIRTWDESDV